jgi:two-component system cell cycle sensor histidine kinase/response regulator CckA
MTSVGQVPMERLRTIFDGMFDGVWLIGGDGRTTYVNESLAGMLGTTTANMHGRPITDFLSKEFRAVAEALIDNQRESDGERVDLRFLRADGEDLWTLVAASPIVTADGSYVGSMLNVSDVTGKRAAQVQALQNQKLEAVGAFAAGISHDFNNLLTAIRGYAELASNAVESDSSAHADLEQVIASADRAHGITSKLLAFTRRQVLTPIVVDPARVISDMLPILRLLMSDEVEIRLDARRGGASIRVDPEALEQILVNLAVNANDAMPAGGTLTISVDEVEGHGRQALGADGPLPASVRIRTSDSGTGMDEATVARVFDPFYTTKDLGKGTGLGLSIVYGLVTQLGGEIHVDSTLGAGSSFTFLLPKVASEPDSLDDHAIEPPEPAVGVVLMVEDERTVREFARRVLDGAGHTLLTAGNAAEALAAAADWAGSIDVLLTDVVMPGLRGPALAAKVRALRPNIGVIYMSGYAADAIGTAADALPGMSRIGATAAFLPKPFTAATLIQTVAQEIGLARSRAARGAPLA